jgi:hypothetical protein
VFDYAGLGGVGGVVSSVFWLGGGRGVKKREDFESVGFCGGC